MFLHTRRHCSSSSTSNHLPHWAALCFAQLTLANLSPEEGNTSGVRKVALFPEHLQKNLYTIQMFHFACG